MTLTELKAGIREYIVTNTNKSITGNLLQGWLLNIVDYFNTNSYTPPYKTYSCSMSQNGTDDPVIEAEFVNEIGVITWSRVGAGIYQGVSSGLFTNNKTYTQITTSPYRAISIQWQDINTIYIFCSSHISIGDGTVDSFAGNINIEIKVYN